MWRNQSHKLLSLHYCMNVCMCVYLHELCPCICHNLQVFHAGGKTNRVVAENQYSGIYIMDVCINVYMYVCMHVLYMPHYETNQVSQTNAVHKYAICICVCYRYSRYLCAARWLECHK